MTPTRQIQFRGFTKLQIGDFLSTEKEEICIILQFERLEIDALMLLASLSSVYIIWLYAFKLQSLDAHVFVFRYLVPLNSL